MLEFGLSIIMFAFVMTALFSKAKVGLIISIYQTYCMSIRVQRILLFLEVEEPRPFDGCKIEI
jgi:hypothetical protein